MSVDFNDYTCDICHDMSSGYDLEMKDTNKKGCSHGHVFCDNHIHDIEINTMEQLSQVANDYFYCDGDPESNAEDIMDLIGSGKKPDLIAGNLVELSYQKDENYNGFSDVFCPICNMQEFSDEDLFLYLIKIGQIDREKLKNEIRYRYKNRKDFNDFVFSSAKKSVPKEDTSVSYRTDFTKHRDDVIMLVILYPLAEKGAFELYTGEQWHSVDVSKHLYDFVTSLNEYDMQEDQLEWILDTYFAEYKPAELLKAYRKSITLNTLGK